MRYVKNTRKNIEIEFASVEEIMASAQYREDMRNPKAGTKNATMRDWKYNERRDTFPNVDAPSKYAGILSDEDLDNALTSPPQWLIDGGNRCLDEIEASIAPRIDAPGKRRRRIGVEDGDTINVDRFLTRDPEPWERMERKRHTSPIVVITCDMGTNWKMQKHTLLWRGAAAVASAMAVERMGGRCEIWGVKSVTDPGKGVKRLTTRVLVKRADESTSMSRTLTALGHVGFYRYVTLQACNTSLPVPACGSYGAPTNVPRATLKDLQSDIHISRDATTPARAIEVANQAITNFEGRFANV